MLMALAAMCVCGASIAANAQEVQAEKKTGWGFGALPCATYSSDMGFQYGVFGDFYYYGDGSTYPNYQRYSTEAIHTTALRLSRTYEKTKERPSESCHNHIPCS